MALHQHINVIFRRYLDNVPAPGDMDILFEFFGAANEQELRGLIVDALFNDDGLDQVDAGHEKKLQLIYQRIDKQISSSEQANDIIVLKRKYRLWPQISVAASLLLMLSYGTYFYVHRQSGQQTAKQVQVIVPGHNQATLTLGNGQTIILTKGMNGKLASQGGTLVQVNAGNQLAYSTEGHTAKSDNKIYNILSTKKGEQSPYPLILPDGSKVWLNAASSIRFPIAFNNDYRQVEITGEAYFEVAHNRHKPFRVSSNGQVVEVLGTHFNINSYQEEGVIKTDLLEGSVKVERHGMVALLKPGQESITKSTHSLISVKNADVQMSVAWKDGLFSFKRADIQTVMREVARWYDVDVSYEGTIPTTAITGTFDRNVNADQGLQILSNLDIHFKIVGKKIVIMQK